MRYCASSLTRLLAEAKKTDDDLGDLKDIIDLPEYLKESFDSSGNFRQDS